MSTMLGPVGGWWALAVPPPPRDPPIKLQLELLCSLTDTCSIVNNGKFAEFYLVSVADPGFSVGGCRTIRGVENSDAGTFRQKHMQK